MLLSMFVIQVFECSNIFKLQPKMFNVWLHDFMTLGIYMFTSSYHMHLGCVLFPKKSVCSCFITIPNGKMGECYAETPLFTLEYVNLGGSP